MFPLPPFIAAGPCRPGYVRSTITFDDFSKLINDNLQPSLRIKVKKLQCRVLAMPWTPVNES